MKTIFDVTPEHEELARRLSEQGAAPAGYLEMF